MHSFIRGMLRVGNNSPRKSRLVHSLHTRLRTLLQGSLGAELLKTAETLGLNFKEIMVLSFMSLKSTTNLKKH
jgi:hypothetical protein